MATKETIQILIEGLYSGNKRSLSKLISFVELGDKHSEKIYSSVKDRLGKAMVIGLTGPPGAGKSTLSSSLVSTYRKKSKSIGVLAFDPNSPFTGGAVLGDRVRMQEHYLDSDVFIRSFSNRGASGGLAPVAYDAINLLDAFGFDVILVETVGVGQTELDVINVVDIVLGVVVPEGGDSVQSMKAGLMEIADVFVVNKSDRPGADRMVANIKSTMTLLQNEDVKILKTQANKAIGIDHLAEVVYKIYMDRNFTGLLDSIRQKRRVAAMLDWVRVDLNNKIDLISSENVDGAAISEIYDKVCIGDLNPRTGANLILGAMLK